MIEELKPDLRSEQSQLDLEREKVGMFRALLNEEKHDIRQLTATNKGLSVALTMCWRSLSKRSKKRLYSIVKEYLSWEDVDDYETELEEQQ